MIEKVNLNQIHNISGELSHSRPGAVKTCDNAKSCSPKIDFDQLVEQAKTASESDPEAVEKARKLLDSGELESQENILKAAENMIKYGI
jgi:arginine utilization protein RocB